MKGVHYFWAFALVVSGINTKAQRIVRLKNSQPPIICYAEQKPGVHSYLGEPAVFKKIKQAGAKTKTVNIEVDYINFPPEAESAFEYAVSIWESLISSPVTIHVTAVWSNLSSGTLGSAGPSFWASNFNGVPKFNIYYPGPLAEKLARSDLNGIDEPDIVAQFNSATSWYFQTSGTPASGQYDFITVVLHELGHGFGFTSTFNVASGVGRYGEFTDGIPFPFDLSIENLSSQNLYQNFNSPSTQLAEQLTSNNIFIETPSNATKLQLYAPATFNDGSSIAHLDPAANPQGTANSLMRPFINVNEVNHNPGPAVNNIFRDLGWVTTYIDHHHLNDRENFSQPIPVTAIIKTDETDGYTFDSNQVLLNYSINGSPFTQSQMLPTGIADEFSATIPAAGASSLVQYNIQVIDNLNRTLSHPGEYYEPGEVISQKGPITAYYSFFAGPDVAVPEIDHTPKTFVSYLDTDLVIDVSIKESSDLSTIQLEYIFNSDPPQISSLALTGSEPDLFDGTTIYHYRKTITFAPGQLQDGDVIKYRIIAKDNSSNANQATAPLADYFILPVEGLAPSRTYYQNNFNTPSDDFIGNEFSISQPSGFSDPAIHSQHPYAEATSNGELDFTYQLRIPIIINDRASLLSFDEIVLVEPGEDGSKFGDADFYDYVVVEGSANGGTTWIPIADGYDSREKTIWLAAYGNNEDGQSTLFQHRTINLADRFFPGEEVVFRFRLHSDPFGNAWGWTIDNLTIQVDDVAPQILHNHFDYVTGDIAGLSIPVSVSDDLLLDKISLDFSVNNGTIQHQEMTVKEQSIFADFSIDVSRLIIGDEIRYRFEAVDSAGNRTLLPAMGYFVVPKIQFNDAVLQYTNNFNSLTADFVGNFFEIAQPPGFINGAMHTPHPYLRGFGVDNKSDFSYTLKRKIIVNADNPYIRFDEVCLAENHEENAIFGSSAFKDYVLMEASKDSGVTWTPLLDGYDSNDRQEWLNAYNQNQIGSAALLRTRYINILETDGLNPGDEIIIRFRLYSDGDTQGWGWAIDNLHIQDEITDVEGNDVVSELTIYPNPIVQDRLYIDFQLRNQSNAIITVINTHGALIDQKSVDPSGDGKGSASFDVASFANGLYLLRFTADGKSTWKKFIVQR
ncbi:MAG TPA: T9SS type A sorting domain-containing protein [Cyclobacteriaceae bacterium]|nr:T9SS type A sorting domain-containing protein [Cyclobacteriaceae bacterium]